MDLSSAINVIESVAGFTDTETAVGEAWAVVMAQLEAAPVPVPVSERLPEPEDCNEDGKCWAWRGFDPDVDDDGEFWQLSPAEWLDEASCWTHWLSANALPLPQGEVE